MFRSLRFRMASSHALVLAVILVVLGGVVQFLLARSLIHEAGRLLPPTDSDVPSAAAVQIAVYGAPGDQLVGEPSEIPSWLTHHSEEVTDLRVGGEHVRVVTVPVSSQGSIVGWVVAGRSLLAESDLLHRVRLLLLLGGGAAVAASLGAGWWLAGRALQPVQQAYEAQAGFAADASHELRTPLAFIRSGVEVLAENDSELGREVLSEVDYLTGLTQRLLLLARAEHGQVSLATDRMELGAACRSAAHRSETAHGNRLTLTGGDLSAEGDRVGLEAALDAVLENVARHGGGAADVRWSAEGPEAVVSVVDHGPGIPAAFSDRVFDRFFRADPSRARSTGGAGLGLALARTLIEAQGGRMWLDQTPGGGLTAGIALPLG